MEKALEFLEKYCQWLAVGLGGVFLAWMLWSYVLMSPVTVAGPGNTEYNPGNVDTEVNRNSAKPVENLLNDNGTPVPPAGATKVPVDEFTEGMSSKHFNAPPLPTYVINSAPSDFKVNDGSTGPDLKRDLVTALPDLPFAPIVEALSKKAYVGPAPLVNGAPAPPQPAPVAQPVQPVAANGQPANGQPANGPAGERPARASRPNRRCPRATTCATCASATTSPPPTSPRPLTTRKSRKASPPASSASG